MKKVYLLGLPVILLLSGCLTTRTYELTRDRVDQGLTEGNRGYIMGSHPGDDKAKKDQRTIRVFEIELGKTYQSKEGKTVGTPAGETVIGLTQENYYEKDKLIETDETITSYQKYTVQKNDTLQKISQKFYGTTKKWNKIYEANKETLKTPDRVYPGQVLNIPEAKIEVVEIKENLK